MDKPLVSLTNNWTEAFLPAIAVLLISRVTCIGPTVSRPFKLFMSGLCTGESNDVKLKAGVSVAVVMLLIIVVCVVVAVVCVRKRRYTDSGDARFL